MQHNDRGINF